MDSKNLFISSKKHCLVADPLLFFTFSVSKYLFVYSMYESLHAFQFVSIVSAIGWFKNTKSKLLVSR